MARSDHHLRILIVGGGIAGLTTAITLRDSGRRIIVLEQSRMNKEIGALISLQPNASKIATRFGLDPYLQKAQPVTDKALRVLDSAGRLQNETILRMEKYGADRKIYHRVDLHDSLKEAATSTHFRGPPVEIRTSCRVIAVNCDEAIVTLESGETVQGDLLIAADGIHSVVRKFVLGDGYDPVPTGLSAYRLLIPRTAFDSLSTSPTDFDVADPVTTLVVGDKQRVIMGPGRGCELFGAVILVPDESTDYEQTTRSWTTSGSKDQLLKSIETFPSWVKEIVKCAPDDLAVWQLRDIDPLPTWVKGRTILIGDASHAMLPTQGQGASQSFEDAEALQALFEDVQDTPSASEVNKKLLEVFNSRFARVSLIQKYSRLQGKGGISEKCGKVTLNPGEFLDYNCNYEGVKDWNQRWRQQQ